MKKKTLKGIAEFTIELLHDLGRILPQPFESKYQYAARLKRFNYPTPSIHQEVKRLHKSGLVKKVKNSDKYKLTKSGEIKYLLTKIKNNRTLVTKGYLLVVFDIPEDNRRLRRQLRLLLIELGFRNIQRSVMIGRSELNKEFYDYLNIIKLSKSVKVVRII